MNKSSFYCSLLVLCTWSHHLIAQSIELSVQKGHSGNINVVVFNGDGRLLARAGADNQIKLWHVPTGKEMSTFISTISTPILNLKFIDDDNYLIIKHQDGGLQRWNIQSSKQESNQLSDQQVKFNSLSQFYTRDSSEQIF